jgi:hypothetical protein
MLRRGLSCVARLLPPTGNFLGLLLIPLLERQNMTPPRSSGTVTGTYRSQTIAWGAPFIRGGVLSRPR